MARFLVLDEKDTVAVALEPAEMGVDAVLSSGRRIKIKQDIPFAHKIAVAQVKTGGKIIKFGQVIGRAIKDISPGDHVHVHNIKSLRVGGKQ